MPRPRLIRPEELTADMLFRLKVVGWIKRYFVDPQDNRYIRIPGLQATDIINNEPLETKGLMFDLLRYVAASERPGYLVVNKDDPLDLKILAKLLYTDLETLIPALKRLIALDLVQLHYSNGR